jgi:hypothetical protein
VPGLDRVVAELHRLVHARLQRLLRRAGEGHHLARRVGLVAEPDGLDDLGARRGAVHPERRHIRQRHQQVLGADVPVPHHARLVLGDRHDLPGLVGETLEHQARRRYPFSNSR